jgi:hypothetical protein
MAINLLNESYTIPPTAYCLLPLIFGKIGESIQEESGPRPIMSDTALAEGGRAGGGDSAMGSASLVDVGERSGRSILR